MAVTGTTHQTAKTQYVKANDTVTYAYHTFGNTSTRDPPVVLLMHFRGTMDYWDPLLVNSIAATRPVILFDNAGVGQSTGQVANSIKGMADHVLTFIQLLGLPKIDILGFSFGGYVAQLVALNGSHNLIRKLIIAASGPSFGEGVAFPSAEQQAEIARLAGSPSPSYDDGFDKLFFAPSTTSQAAGQKWYKRVAERNPSTSGEERSLLVSTDYADQGVGLQAMITAGNKLADPAYRTEGSYDRLSEITVPVLIAQGKEDFMIPTVNSFVFQQKLPNARLKIWPDSGHGFLYQFAEEFARDVNQFLDADV